MLLKALARLVSVKSGQRSRHGYPKPFLTFYITSMIEQISIWQPSPWIVKHAPLIRNNGRVLDLACGSGRHAIWLAKQGYRVDALDRDARALANMAGMDNINVFIVDLEAGDWPGSGQRYDGIIVSRYLYRPLLARLAELLNSDGILVYETFMAGNERYGKPSNPDFLLLPNELLEIYSPLLGIIAFEQGEVKTPRPAVMQRICAKKNS
jgi:SAM-dependent methyltransferase